MSPEEERELLVRFACAALQGVSSIPWVRDNIPDEQQAKEAWGLAQAMLDARPEGMR